MLERIVHEHESHFMADKLIKTVGFACGLSKCWFRRPVSGYGEESDLAVGLGQIAAKCADARYVLRFHGGYCGLLVEADNLKNCTFLGGWKWPVAKKMMYAQSLSLIFYYICENAAYLGWTAPGLIGKRLKALGGADEVGRVSCIGWAAWCFLDMIATWFKLKELKELEERVEAAAQGGPAQAEAERVIGRCRKALWMNMLRSFCFFVPDVQWSLPAGSRWAIQPDWCIQGLSFIECIVGYYAYWNGFSTSRPTVPPEALQAKN